MAGKWASVLDVDRITNVLQRRCESMGVSLQWSEDAATAMTDGKTIILPVVKQPVTREAMEKLYGFVIHECGHHSRPEAFEILAGAIHYGAGDAISALFNITEDDGMERDVARAWAGDAKALGESNANIIKRLGLGWKEQLAEKQQELTEQDVAPIACTGLGQLSRMSWDSHSNSNRHYFMNNMHPVAKGLLDDLVTEGWVDKFKATKNPHDTWDLAIDLVKRLYPGADDDKMEECREAGHKGRPEDGEGDGEKQQDTGDGGEQDGDGDNVNGQGIPNEDGLCDADGKLPGEGEVIHWKDAVTSQHDEWQPKDPNEQAGNIGIDWTDYQAGNVALMPQKLVNVVDCTKRSTRSTSNDRYNRQCGSPKSFMPNNQESRAFANQIRRYVQAQARTRFDTEKYHGRLDKRSIVKLALPPIDGGEWNKKLFYQMTRQEAKDTAIMVLTDWSGSMSGTKMIHAADASGRLVQVFDRILRMPVQLAAFTNGASRCDIGLIKKFDDRSVSPQDIANGFSRFYPLSSANNDADAVMWAYNQIRRRKEERKILMVLSDGCPAGSWIGGSSGDNLLHVTEHIEREGKVELYGVGIKSDAVETYYSNCQVLNDETEINRTLFEIIKGGVKNARRQQ